MVYSKTHQMIPGFKNSPMSIPQLSSEIILDPKSKYTPECTINCIIFMKISRKSICPLGMRGTRHTQARKWRIEEANGGLAPPPPLKFC